MSPGRPTTFTLPTEEISLAEALKPLGYQTALIRQVASRQSHGVVAAHPGIR